MQIKKNDLLQPTDLYPEIAKSLWGIMRTEMIHTKIQMLPYLPSEYINRASEKSPGKIDILSVFDEGVFCSFLKFYKTNYYHIMTSINKISLLTLCIYTIKFYRYSRYIKRLGVDLHVIFRDHQKRDLSCQIGKVITCDIRKALPTKEFDVYDKDILQLFEKNIFSIIIGLKNTNYFYIQRNKRRKSLKLTLKFIHKYYKLFVSMKKNGIIDTKDGLHSYPWLFVSKKVTMRLDGHHRCGIATHLKQKSLQVLLITPEDLKNHEGMSPKFIQSLL